jgi:hypothetical protein
MKFTGHGMVTVSHRYLPPQSVENAVARLEALNTSRRKKEGTKMGAVPFVALFSACPGGEIGRRRVR